MDITQAYREQIFVVQSYIINKITSSFEKTLSGADCRLLNEALIALDKTLNYGLFPAHNIVLLEKTYRYGSDATYERLNYFSNYYYAYSEISSSDLDLQQTSLIKVNTSTATMMTRILGFNKGICDLGGSTDDYYVDRMERVFWGIKTILKREQTDIYLPMMYTLVNLCQSLTEYLFSKDNQYRNKATRLLQEANSKLEGLIKVKQIQEILSSNLQLRLFFLVQKSRILKALSVDQELSPIYISELPNMRTEQKLRILSTLFYLNRDNFTSLFELNFEFIYMDIQRSTVGLNNFLFLECLSSYFISKPLSEEIELNLNSLNKEKIEVSDHFKCIFNNYEESHAVSISKDEINLLIGYNDEILRNKVSKMILGVDKAILERERQKPHGGFEISDMEVRIKLGKESYFLCIPFKSGQEIASNTVPESIAYQIFRPFIHFDKTIVIFITAKRCSQNLMNYIKRMQDKLKWGIAVLENEELAKLLKVNGMLN